MRIKKAEFITSLVDVRTYDMSDMTGICIVGKSNVGKSSLINALAGNSKLARTSSEPGKTRLINLFRFTTDAQKQFMLVDLPGYGFAKVSHDEKYRWQTMIEDYLSHPQSIAHAFLLVDIRHDPGEDDLAMAEYLRHFGIEFTVIATKADKLSRAKIHEAIHAVCRGLQVQPWEVLPTSADKKTGLDAVCGVVERVMNEFHAQIKNDLC